MAKVLIENLYKIYPAEKGRPEKVAVDNANFEIQDREFMVLVGPSGCGKTTTLRMVAGLEEISRGAIYIDGKKINEIPPKDRDIAMVFQNYALYPHMSVYRNMAFGLELRGVPKEEIRRRVDSAAKTLGLLEPDNLLERKPKALSGGQRQRVALGRAIVREPKAFLFDEPLSNLDAKMRVETRTEISRLHRQLASTMIYVTHDQTEAMTMADRIVVMRYGKIQQIAAPLDLYHQPANLFVAGFIGSPPMNFFTGILTASSQGTLEFVEKVPADQTPFRCPLSAETSRRLSSRQDREVILGLRPEHLHPNSLTSGVTLLASVEVVEPMGAETFVYLRTGGHTCICRTTQGEFMDLEGKKLNLGPDLSRAVFFDPETESAIPV
jgi:multiple sugar transport system ATP-binding protein